jgi:hypothetical protein
MLPGGFCRLHVAKRLQLLGVESRQFFFHCGQ